MQSSLDHENKCCKRGDLTLECFVNTFLGARSCGAPIRKGVMGHHNKCLQSPHKGVLPYLYECYGTPQKVFTVTTQGHLYECISETMNTLKYSTSLNPRHAVSICHAKGCRCFINLQRACTYCSLSVS